MTTATDGSTRVQRLAAGLLAAVALATAGGCSAIKLGYETLPTWAFFQIDRYWRLDSRQSELVRARLDEFQHWHRRNELPQYARFLEGIKERARDRIDEGDLKRWREAADARWAAMTQHAAAPLAEVALTLKPEQIERMRKRLDEQNAEFRRKNLPADPAERQEKRIERIADRAEFFFGRLNDAQREAVRRHAAAVAAEDEAMYAERLARQQAVVATFEKIATTRPAPEEARRQLESVFAQLWKPHDAQRVAALDRSSAATEQLTVALVNAATPPQKSKMAQRLSTWTGDLQILASR